MFAVTVQVQYTYIYRCLLDAVTTGETAIVKSALGNSYAKMTNEISRQFDVSASKIVCRNMPVARHVVKIILSQ